MRPFFYSLYYVKEEKKAESFYNFFKISEKWESYLNPWFVRFILSTICDVFKNFNSRFILFCQIKKIPQSLFGRIIPKNFYTFLNESRIVMNMKSTRCIHLKNIPQFLSDLQNSKCNLILFYSNVISL